MGTKRRVYLGVDVGTTATKAILVDAAQRVIASRSVGHPTLQPAPGFSEQEPDAWIRSVTEALAALRSDAGGAYASVGRIGLSGQMHSLVALDGDDRRVRPAMLWNDVRGATECAALERRVPDLARISGAAAMPSFTAAKLGWVRAHEPAAFARIRHLLLPKDYVRLWLTGEHATDMSDAAGTQLFDQSRRAWSAPIAAAVGVSPDWLPPLHEGSETGGGLRAVVAAELGLRPGLPIAVGGGDASAGALGIGCVDRGSSFISLGTGATFIVVTERYEPAASGFLHDFAHCVPERWYRMAAMLNGASCLSWAARLIGATDIDRLLADVETRFTEPSRVLFLPYLSGERTPYNDTAVRGAFVGLDAMSDPLDIAQAVLEGVAFSLRDAQSALGAADRTLPDPGFIGGGSRSPLWSRIIATVLGRPIVRFAGAELGPALGAARLAMLSEPGAALSAIARPPAVASVIDPDPALVERYAERHADFMTVYPALAEFARRPARPV